VFLLMARQSLHETPKHNQPDGNTTIKTSAVEILGAVRELQRHVIGSRLGRSHAAQPHHVSSPVVRSNDRARPALLTSTLASPIELIQRQRSDSPITSVACFLSAVIVDGRLPRIVIDRKEMRALPHTPSQDGSRLPVLATNSLHDESSFRSRYPIPTVSGLLMGSLPPFPSQKHPACFDRTRLRTSSHCANPLRSTIGLHLVTYMRCRLR
jgi:hypothetical protein